MFWLLFLSFSVESNSQGGSSVYIISTFTSESNQMKHNEYE